MKFKLKKNKNMKMEKEEADKEVRKFHIQLLRNVIKVIKLNQKEVKKVNFDEEFILGSLSFGDVIIYQLNEEIKNIKKTKT